MHWTDERTAVANLGLALQRRGWKLYGWHRDQSDSMTDYYCPERWDGIAEKDGCVVAVRKFRAKREAGEQRVRYVAGETCPRCHGTGADPDGWTHKSAQANPREFHRQRAAVVSPGAITLFPDILSPLEFRDDGRERCRQCDGRGHMMKAETYTIPWPAHQANPKGRTWHVERDGQIIASGVGLERCLKGGADALAARIDSAVAKRSAGSAGPQAAGGTVSVRENEERDGVEVSFPDKPAPDVLDRLRAAGFRWHRQLRYWYAKRNPETLALARSLLS